MHLQSITSLCAAMHRGRHGLGLVSVGVLTGCTLPAVMPGGGAPGTWAAPLGGSDAQPVPVEPGPAPRPLYARGDSYVFGRGNLQQVVKSQGGTVHWTAQDTAYQTTRDFFVPLLRHDFVTGHTVSRIQGKPDALWPLAVGKAVSFEEVRTETLALTGTALTQTYRWTCRVADARMSYVPAGDYATYHVVCRGYLGGVPLPVQVVSWDYAPVLGHYVRRRWMADGRLRESVLSAVLPGSAATPERLQRILWRLASDG